MSRDRRTLGRRAAVAFLIGWGITSLGILGVWGAAAYVVIHFILKLW